MTGDDLTTADVATLVWWTTTEAARRWRISEDTVLRMIRDKDIKAKKFGRQWRIHSSVIDAYEAGGKARRVSARPDVVRRCGDPGTFCDSEYLGDYAAPSAGVGVKGGREA